jgi:imidazole glycerol-phosphate synthase subunit HisF
MLARRIIPCLDIKDGRTVKGVNFVQLRDAGDPVELAVRYMDEGADELVFLDITATVEKRKTLRVLVEKISKNISIPFTVGGGVGSVEDARALLYSGADKVAVNSAAVRNPELVQDLSREFGNQAVVLAVDGKCIDDTWLVFLEGGRSRTDREVLSWCREAVSLGAGEILLTSMDHDGTKDGFAISLYQELSEAVSVPVIASGGAGAIEHFIDLFLTTNTSAALAASIFHFSEVAIPDLKKKCLDAGVRMRMS